MIKAQEPKKELCSRRVKLAVLASLLVTTGVCVWAVVDATQVSVDATLNLNGDQTGSDADLYISGQGTGINAYEVGATDCKIDYSQNGKAWERMSHLKNENPGSSMSKTHLGFHNTDMRVLRGALSQIMWNKLMNSTVSPAHEPLVRVECNGEATASLFHAIPITKAYHHKMEVPVSELERNGGLTVTPKNFEPKKFLNDLLSKGLEYDIEVKYAPNDANPFPVQLRSIEVEVPALEYASATPVEEPHQWNIATKAFTVSVTPELISAVIPVSMTANCEQVPVSPYESVDIAGCRLLDRKYVERFISEVQSGDVGIGLKSLKSNFVSKLIGEDHKLTATVLTDQRFGDLAGDEFAIKQEDQGRHLLNVFSATPLAEKFHDKLVNCFNLEADSVKEIKSCIRFDAGFIGLYVVGGNAEVGSTGYKETFKVVHATSWTTFGDFALVTTTDGGITMDDKPITMDMKAVVSEKEEVAKMTANLVVPGSDGEEDLTIAVGGDAAWHFALEDETKGLATAIMKVGGKAGAGDMLDLVFGAGWDHATETMETTMEVMIGNNETMTFVGDGEGTFEIIESWEHFKLVLSKYTIKNSEDSMTLSGTHEFDASNEKLATATTNVDLEGMKVQTIQSWNWVDEGRVETFSLDLKDEDDKTVLKMEVAEYSVYGSNTITSPFKEKLDVKISDKDGEIMTMGAETSMMMSEDMETMEMMMDMTMVMPQRGEKNIGDECEKISDCKTGYCGSPKTDSMGFQKCMECPSNKDFDNAMEGDLKTKLCDEGDDVQKFFLSKCGVYQNFDCHKDKVGKKPLGMDIRIKAPKIGYNNGKMVMGVQLLENNGKDNIVDIGGDGNYDKDNMFKKMDMTADMQMGSGDDSKFMAMSMDYAFDDWTSVKANVGVDDKGKDGKTTSSLFSAEVDVPLTGTYPDAWKASITKAQIVVNKDTTITLTGEVDAGYNAANPTPYFAKTGADGMKMTIKSTDKDDLLFKPMDELTLALTGDFTPTTTIGNADMTLEIVGKADGKDCSTWVKPGTADEDDEGPFTIKISLDGEWDASELTHTGTVVVTECSEAKVATIEQAGTYDDKTSNVLALKMTDFKFGEKNDKPTKVADIALEFTKASAINNGWIMYVIPEAMKFNADVRIGDFTDFDNKGDLHMNLMLTYDIIDYGDRLMLGTDMLIKSKSEEKEENGIKTEGKLEPVISFSEVIDWTQNSAELDFSLKMPEENKLKEIVKLNTISMYDLDKDYLLMSNVMLWVGGEPLAFVTVYFGAIEDKPDVAPEIDDALGLACLALSSFNKAVKTGCRIGAKACLTANKKALGQYSADMCREWSENSFNNECAANIIGDGKFLHRYLGNNMCGKLEKEGKGACATPGAKSCLKRCLQCVKASEDGITLKAGKDADGDDCSTCEICGKWRKCATFLKRVVSKSVYSSAVPVDKKVLEKIKAEYLKAAESTQGDAVDNAQQTVLAVVEEIIKIAMKFENALSAEQKAAAETESCISVNAKQNVDVAPATCTLTKSRRLRRLLADNYEMLITVPESEGMNLEEIQSEIAVVAEENGGTAEAATSELSTEVTLIMVVTAADESTLEAISKDISSLSESILTEMVESPDFVKTNGGVAVDPKSITTEVEVEAPPEAPKSLTDLALDEKKKEDDDISIFSGAGTLTLSAVAVLFSALL